MRPAARAILVAAVLHCLVRGATAQTDYRVLPADFNQDKTQQMMRAYLRRQVHQALDRRLGELEAAVGSIQQIEKYQHRRREFLRWTLGEMPQRTPLDPRVWGRVAVQDYRIEKVVFESQPGFHVTGNLYRPDGPGPFPAILHPCGHSENGKAAAAYQKVNRLLAQNGFIVLCYDPLGQGERKQILTADGKPSLRATSEHQQLGPAAILLGRTLAAYMVWDGVRGIDYLCSRPDVDTSRIGCTGNSGGGNMTSYLMAYDERIVAAAPGCFVTTHRRKNESPGPGDAEQNLFAQIRERFDHPDFLISRAPRPTLILAATRDFVPIEGTWEAFRQAKRVYTTLGHPERVELVETDAKHGYSRRLREAAVRFFARWLQGRQLDVFEADDVPVMTDQQLQVTPQGQVLEMPAARSVFELFASYEKELARARPPLTEAVVREVTGIRPLADLPQPKVERRGPVSSSLPHKLVFHPEPGIVLPALYWPGGGNPPRLIAHPQGMNAAAADAERLHAAGHPVLLVDVRDCGETATRNWRFPGADYYIAHMLGRCWLGMRSEDLLVCARWLAEEEKVDSVDLTAFGEIGPAAQHASALEPQLIGSLRVDRSLASWRSLVTDTGAYPHLPNAVQRALRFYDLPDLKKLQHPAGREH